MTSSNDKACFSKNVLFRTRSFSSLWRRFVDHLATERCGLDLRAKREIIQYIASDNKATITLLQKTHQTSSNKLKLCGYTLADWIPHQGHGIATFVQATTSFTHDGKSFEDNPTERSTISINNINITNLYHLPTVTMDTSNLPPVSAASVISGDFNCHHENWGYSTRDYNEKCLADWYCNHDL